MPKAGVGRWKDAEIDEDFRYYDPRTDTIYGPSYKLKTRNGGCMGFVQIRKRVDYRALRDRQLANRENSFQLQMPSITDAYIEWQSNLGDKSVANAGPPLPVSEPPEGAFKVKVLDTDNHAFTLQTDVVESGNSTCSKFVRYGLIPCAPFKPSLVVTTRLLESYHHSAPETGAQTLVRNTCKDQEVKFSTYIVRQFKTCYDIFLQLRAEVESRSQRSGSDSASQPDQSS